MSICYLFDVAEIRLYAQLLLGPLYFRLVHLILSDSDITQTFSSLVLW